MARPIKLVKRKVLEEIYKKFKMGVPLSLLIREHSLDLSRPSLAKLISYLTERDEADAPTKDIIEDSLYPAWAEKNKRIVVIAKGNKYIGQMPNGYWETNDWSNK